jgi:AcrR family transcriptional regulator
LERTGHKGANQTARQKIMDAAGKLFSEKGYTETSTLAIAREAGVNESSIFRNFGSKRNLYIEIFFSNTPGVENILLKDLTYGVNLKEDLSLMIREYISTCVKHIPTYRLSVQQIDDLEDHLFYLQSSTRFDSMETQMISYFSMLRSLGRIVEIDSEALSEYLFALFLVKAPQFVGRGEQGLVVNEQEMEAFAAECTEYVCGLLAVEDPPQDQPGGAVDR